MTNSADPELRDVIDVSVGDNPAGDWLGSLAALLVDVHERREAERDNGRDSRVDVASRDSEQGQNAKRPQTGQSPPGLDPTNRP